VLVDDRTVAAVVLVEGNAVDRPALGRKNWTFAGSDEGGRRAAAIYTLIATAKLNDVDPQTWLADVLARLPGSKRSSSIEEGAATDARISAYRWPVLLSPEQLKSRAVARGRCLMEESPCANTSWQYAPPLSLPFPRRLRSHRSMLRLALEVSMWDLVTIAPTIIAMKVVVVAAENYEQLVCTRKN